MTDHSPPGPPENPQLKLLLENINGISWELDLETMRFTYVSSGAERILGYPVSAWKDIDAWIDMIVPEDREYAATRCTMEAAAGRDHTFEYRMRRADGALIWVLDVVTVLKDDAGRPERLAGFILDYSEQHRLLEELRQSEARFRTFFERNSSVMLLIEPQSGRIEDANPTAARFYGWSQAELRGREITEINTLPQDRIAAERERALREERNFFQFQHRLADGEIRDVEVYSTPVEINDQRLLFSIIHDVTERRRAERRLELAASVFSHAREGILIADANARIVEVNAAFTRITGYEREDALGRNPGLLSSGVHGPDFYEALWDHLIAHDFWSGEIWNRRKDGELYCQSLTITVIRDESGETCNFVALFADISDQKEQQRQLERAAHYDPLTDLPNRVLLADRMRLAMSQAERRGQLIAVAYLDLDGFKAVNDEHGHDVGDQLLKTVAARLRRALREGDTMARMGGDEFVAVLADLDAPEQALPVIERLLQTAARAAVIPGGARLEVSASVGVAFYPQSEAVDADQLLRQADQAMYQAKLAGRNRYSVFDADQHHSDRGRFAVLERMRLGLAGGEFCLAYQPIVRLRGGGVEAAEALLRWKDPERGLQMPGEFLPLTEGRAVAAQLGEFVLETAVAQLADWRRRGLRLDVCVNVSGDELQRDGFADRVRELLERYPDAPPSSLQLEILETSALKDMDRVSHVIRACRKNGVRFALDDFGTGYSSLAYLKQLPASRLKIDRSFVRDMLEDPDDLAILNGILGLATAFRREAVAEGVESAEHVRMLLRLGCDLAQGFWIARPMAPEKMDDWVRDWKPAPEWARERLVDREDLPLLFASVEHRAWLGETLRGLGEDGGAFPTLEPHRRRFGRWLEEEGRRRYGQRAEFTELERRHASFHALAEQLAAERIQSGEAIATNRLDELRASSRALQDCLENLLHSA